MRSPDTPDLVRSITQVFLLLIDRTTAPGSADRFEKLWTLLGEGIIESVWVYGYEELATLQATLDVLPAVFRALGIGTARYLKARFPFLRVRAYLAFSSSICMPSPSFCSSSIRSCRPRRTRAPPRFSWRRSAR